MCFHLCPLVPVLTSACFFNFNLCLPSLFTCTYVIFFICGHLCLCYTMPTSTDCFSPVPNFTMSPYISTCFNVCLYLCLCIPTLFICTYCTSTFTSTYLFLFSLVPSLSLLPPVPKLTHILRLLCLPLQELTCACLYHKVSYPVQLCSDLPTSTCSHLYLPISLFDFA